MGAVPATLAVLEEFVPNEGDGWRYVVDALAHGLEDALATSSDEDLLTLPPRGVVTGDPWELAPAHPLVGPHMEWASLLGKRTAEMHVALTSLRGRTRTSFPNRSLRWTGRPCSTVPGA